VPYIAREAAIEWRTLRDVESQMPDGSYICVIRALWTVAALVLAAGPVAGHDFWIVPGAFRPDVGEKVGLSLRVGEHFRGEPVLIDRKLVERFFVVGPAGESPVVPRQGSEPAGFVRIEAPGLWIVGYRSRPSQVSLEAEQFERYLLQEGLDTIVDLRASRGESGTRAQEIFSRCAKTLLSAGPGAKGHDRPLGLRLELIAEENPYALRPGQQLSVRLLYEGDPLPAALVVAINSDEPDERMAARSDSTGRATFRLGRAGAWLIKAVHMIPAPPDAAADWESLWASVTFQIPPEPK
jgi:Domain of unknown function (DUF4198)